MTRGAALRPREIPRDCPGKPAGLASAHRPEVSRRIGTVRPPAVRQRQQLRRRVDLRRADQPEIGLGKRVRIAAEADCEIGARPRPESRQRLERSLDLRPRPAKSTRPSAAARANVRIVSTRLPGMPMLAKSASATHSGVTEPQRSTSRRISVPAAATVTCWPRMVRTHSSNGDHAPRGRMPGTLAMRRFSTGERRRCLWMRCAS